MIRSIAIVLASILLIATTWPFTLLGFICKAAQGAFLVGYVDLPNAIVSWVKRA